MSESKRRSRAAIGNSLGARLQARAASASEASAGTLRVSASVPAQALTCGSLQ
jgi:hypothetical protein